MPANFTLVTGKDHWELLLRARAVENQCYVAAAAQIGEVMPGRPSYGRSLIVDPWGIVLAEAPDEETVVVAELDRERLRRFARSCRRSTQPSARGAPALAREPSAATRTGGPRAGLTLRAVLFDVDFTLAKPGPELGPEGYRRAASASA